MLFRSPLSSRRHDDSWAWHYDRSGILSVKSVYGMLVRTRQRRVDWIEERPAGSNQEREEKMWQKLWKVQVPSKVRMFLWRLAHQSLPTGDVRHHRHMADTSVCSICGAEDSWRHSLLNCTMSRCVWALANEGVTQHMNMIEEPSAKQWIFSLIDTLDHADFVEMVVTLWAIWYARRRLIHEGEQQSPMSTFMFVRSFLDDLAQTPAPSNGQRRMAPIAPALKWIKPPSGCAKINADAAIAKTGEGGSLAVVCRSEDGVFLGASAITMHGSYTPPAMEALACREALALAQDLNIQNICVATDCLEVINNLEKPYFGHYGVITREIKETARLFLRVVFRHEGRVSNGEAH